MSNSEAIMRTANSEQRTANSEQRNFSLKSWLKKHRFINLPLHFLKRLIVFSLWMPYFLCCCIRKILVGDVIFTRSWVTLRRYSIKPANWGDDLNKYFFEYVTGKKVIPLRCNFPSGRYIMIGSVLSFFRLKGAVVYGTGLMTASSSLRGKPDKIISVRGPLTRQALIQRNIDCPEHYGDPALLLPLFYTPSVSQRKIVSIIPNMGTFWYQSPVVDELVSAHQCRLIDMRHYDKWTDIVDAIASSSFVISESLHGLIAAETYRIPNIWVEFIDHNTAPFNNDWSFKFRDFYESIGKHSMTSIKLYEGYDFCELLKLRNEWIPGRIDYEQLLEDFPFPIRPELRRKMNFTLQH